jgi:hypothetical protein
LFAKLLADGIINQWEIDTDGSRPAINRLRNTQDRAGNVPQVLKAIIAVPKHESGG